MQSFQVAKDQILVRLADILNKSLLSLSHLNANNKVEQTAAVLETHEEKSAENSLQTQVSLNEVYITSQIDIQNDRSKKKTHKK